MMGLARSPVKMSLTGVALILGCTLGLGSLGPLGSSLSAQPPESNPAVWGEDHVGKRFPNYLTSGECLFCHRDDIGGAWQGNRHNLTVRPAISDSPALVALAAAGPLGGAPEGGVGEITHLVGASHRVRFLKPNGRYGQLAILSTQWRPPQSEDYGRLIQAETAAWDPDLFANSCAGCHATAVDPKLRGFSSAALDCFTCHGDVVSAHEADTELVLFSRKGRVEPRVEISICGQCHLRGARARSTGLPYANTFVPGDNLFKDFAVDFSPEHLAQMNPGDRHVYQNARDVVVGLRTELTCGTCHDVHDQSTRKHRSLRPLKKADCSLCHPSPEDFSSVIAYQPYSAVCQYLADDP